MKCILFFVCLEASALAYSMPEPERGCYVPKHGAPVCPPHEPKEPPGPIKPQSTGCGGNCGGGNNSGVPQVDQRQPSAGQAKDRVDKIRNAESGATKLSQPSEALRQATGRKGAAFPSR